MTKDTLYFTVTKFENVLFTSWSRSWRLQLQSPAWTARSADWTTRPHVVSSKISHPVTPSTSAPGNNIIVWKYLEVSVCLMKTCRKIYRGSEVGLSVARQYISWLHGLQCDSTLPFLAQWATLWLNKTFLSSVGFTVLLNDTFLGSVGKSVAL